MSLTSPRPNGGGLRVCEQRDGQCAWSIGECAGDVVMIELVSPTIAESRSVAVRCVKMAA